MNAIDATILQRIKTAECQHAVLEIRSYKNKPDFTTTTYHLSKYAAEVYIADNLQAYKKLGLKAQYKYLGV